MSKVNLKDNILIEGFDSITAGEQFVCNNGSIPGSPMYFGKTSDIPEEVAKDCVEYVHGVNGIGYRDYSIFTMVNHKETAKQSIQSACDKPYCIIYKTK